METPEVSRPWNGRRLLVTSVLFASVAVNVVFLAIYFYRPHRASVAAGTQVAEVSRPAATLPAPIPPPVPAVSTASAPGRDSSAGPRTQRLTAGESNAGASLEPSSIEPSTEIPVPAEGAPAPPPGLRPGTPVASGSGSRPAGSHPSTPEARAPLAGRQEALSAQQRSDSQIETPPPTDDEDAKPDENTPGSDRTPPLLGALRFDPPEIADGATTTLLIEVTDDLSGVKAVSGNIRSPSGAAMIPFQAQGESHGGAFLARIPLPAKAETGAWYVAYLSVLDQADNPLVGSFTPQSVPPGGTLRVLSNESDATPPEVRGVSLVKRSVSGGEANVVVMDIEDDHSGVASIMGAFQSASRSGLIRFVGRATSDPRVWEGDLSVPASAECGEWTVQFIRAVDNAGNIAYLSSETQPLAGVGFNVSGSTCDATPPALESLTLSPTTVSNQAAAEVQVTAIVRDEGSGTASMLGWVNGPGTTTGATQRFFFSCTRVGNDPDSPWTGKILVPAHAAAGVWKLGLVRLTDKANNSRDYGPDDPILSQSTFEVR